MSNTSKPKKALYKGFVLLVFPGPRNEDTGKSDIKQIRISHPELEYGYSCLTFEHAKTWCDRMEKQMDKEQAQRLAHEKLSQSGALNLESEWEAARGKKLLA